MSGGIILRFNRRGVAENVLKWIITIAVIVAGIVGIRQIFVALG